MHVRIDIIRRIFNSITSSLQTRILEQSLQELIGIFAATHFGIKDFVAAVVVYPDANKKWRSNFTDYFVNCKIAVREKGKWNIISLFKIADLKGRVASSDTQQFDPAFQIFITFDFLKHFIDRGSLPLTERSVHTKDLDDNNISFYFWNGKGFFAGDPQISLVITIFGYRKGKIR